MAESKKRKRTTVRAQVKAHAEKEARESEAAVKSDPQPDGSGPFISTGSTLLDLAISGGRVRGGGIPCGILVEIFGPAGCGKTVLLCEIAGAIQREGGRVMFFDPEARLNKQFAQIFDLDTDEISYTIPRTVPEVFKTVRDWKPDPPDAPHGIFTDSLAALSTALELGSDEGDKMGMRRAKEFSEQLRRTCAVITEKRYLMVCSNQVRQNVDAGLYSQKYTTPGGEAIGFYSSLRLQCSAPRKVKVTKTISGVEVSRVTAVETEVTVYKSSVWKPYRSAPLMIVFDYGVDDIRQNLKYVKKLTKATTYMVGEDKVGRSIDEAIAVVEEDGLEDRLREQVIDLWEEVEAKFASSRKRKARRRVG